MVSRLREKRHFTLFISVSVSGNIHIHLAWYGKVFQGCCKQFSSVYSFHISASPCGNIIFIVIRILKKGDQMRALSDSDNAKVSLQDM